VIIGKLIPAGTGLDYYQKLREEAIRLYEEDEAAAALAGGGDSEFASTLQPDDILEPDLEPEPEPTA
jgi:hypothetical protein